MAKELISTSSSGFSHSIGMPLNTGIAATTPTNLFSTRHYYEIVNKQQTASASLLFTKHRASASLLFTEHNNTKEHVVIKILRDYKVTRYSLVTPEERLWYQLEALYWNKKFAPRVYKGVAPILGRSYNPNSIVIGEIIENPTKGELAPKAEYALVMSELPKARRLDILLKDKDKNGLQRHIRLLTEYMAYMHTELVEPPISSGNNIFWGSFEQLQNKLEQNLALINLLLRTNENCQYRSSKAVRDIIIYLHLQSFFRINLDQQITHFSRELIISDEHKDTLTRLKGNLRKIFLQNRYLGYFEKRIQQQRIKRCHGDLKAPHIWIMPHNHLSYTDPGEYVRVVDAIDFNASYCNIDILSDLAMLVLDIQARTKSSVLTNRLIDDYLWLTGQDDEISRSVLNYYLLEKAIMRAAVSIIYDNLPELGLTFLEIAEQRMNDLMEGDLKRRADTLIRIPSATLLFANHSK